MRFNARLVVSFGIISLLLVSPAVYSQTCDNERRWGVAQYRDTSIYGVSAKNEVKYVYNYPDSDHVVGSIGLSNPDSTQQGFFEVGWMDQWVDTGGGFAEEKKRFWVAWENISGQYGSADIFSIPIDGNGYYKFYAYNDGAGNFKACVCELNPDETHNRCLPNFPYSKETSYLGFDQGHPTVQGETMSSCDVDVGDRFARFWDLKYTSDTGYDNMVPWDNTYMSYFDFPLVPEFTVYKK